MSLACPSCRARTTPEATQCVACGQRLAGSPVATLETLEFVVIGEPIPQGSMRAIRPGVIVSDNPRLRAWRKEVNAAALRQCGTQWAPWDEPVAVDAVFTMPRPKSAPKTRRTFPAVKPDLDKLTRAIGDALCPKTGFKVLAEDSRIVEFGQLAKTYPAPMNTHPGALDQPGVRIRLRRLTAA